MRKFVWLAAVGLLAIPARGWSQQSGQSSAPTQTSTAAQPPAQTSEPAPQPDSLAEAARKAREQKKEAPKAATVFTNDNIPSSGGISSVGETAAPSDGSAAPAPAAPAASDSDEKAWRTKFDQLHHKLEQDQANLDVMQRELGVLNTQFYPDPVQAMQQQLTRDDINKKTSDIDKMQAQIEADKQAISDAEDDLRKSGGDPGWAR